eukprot:3912561-Rhodomonas_salina.2
MASMSSIFRAMICTSTWCKLSEVYDWVDLLFRLFRMATKAEPALLADRGTICRRACYYMFRTDGKKGGFCHWVVHRLGTSLQTLRASDLTSLTLRRPWQESEQSCGTSPAFMDVTSPVFPYSCHAAK